MQDPRKLAVYSEAGELAIAVYRLTRPFPSEERFGLTQQLRRAVVSVGSNIAEGCGRKGSRALVPFLHNSIGSTNEVEFQAELTARLGYCDKAEVEVVLERVLRTRRMLIRLEAAIGKQGRGERRHPPPPTPPSPPDQPK
jgi:four helix bundle protein